MEITIADSPDEVTLAGLGAAGLAGTSTISSTKNIIRAGQKEERG